MLIKNQNITIQPLALLSHADIQTDILRLDQLDPVISGNKWFKLQYPLLEAREQAATTLVSMGGAYSNHIAALAKAAADAGFKSLGLIRGDANTPLSHTLQAANNRGMELQFISREAYRDKATLRASYASDNHYWIEEGGYGILGANGAAEILADRDISPYTHIICALGTGTTLAGLIQSALPYQQVLGISVLKNQTDAREKVAALLPAEKRDARWDVLHGFHCGGYAKHQPALLDHMRRLWASDGLPTDFVYTGKMTWAVEQLLHQSFFPAGSRLLLIHSGGLQGNHSLPPGTLPFS
jgi:1-aminocyclopropane-1-carboxylate deaminase